MPDIFIPTGHGTFGLPNERRNVVTAAEEWQAHLDAGRLTPRKPTPPHVLATHEHNHRVLGLRFPNR